MPRLQRFDAVCYHTISATFNRRPVFADTRSADLLLETLRYASDSGMAYLLAYAIMPDHLHLLIAPRNDASISDVMHSIKRYTTKRINESKGSSGSIWQQSFYDRAIRTEAHLRLAIQYIHHNPVAAGLTEAETTYRYSSAHPDAFSDVEAFFRA